jgi:hypothetical protein
VAGDVDGTGSPAADVEALGLGGLALAQPGAHPGDQLAGLNGLTT